MAFESMLAYSRLFGETGLGNRRDESPIDSFGVVALEGRVGDVYAEQTFRHFLEVERIRAIRSGRTLFLLLVSLRRCPQHGVRFASKAADSLMRGLEVSVREVDFVGWYRDRRVAGVVLAQGLDEPGPSSSLHIVERVTRVLNECLPGSAIPRLRVRVVRLGSQSK